MREPTYATPSETDDDVADVPVDALTLRRPGTPTTVTELAARGAAATEILEARVLIISTLRIASIRATYPEDWLLFKAPEEQGGQIVGYLQDAGCDRVRDLWGIEIFNISTPEKITGSIPNVFHYLISGSGRCKLTQQTVETIEGGRSSTDDFCRGKEGAELELLVRKAARANLDGNLTRELAGMKSVPVDELKAAWTGTPKKIEQCRRGRGFGTHDERVGGWSDKAPPVEPPVCPHCKTKGVYRPAKGTRAAFYGCPNYEKHGDKKFFVDAKEWAEKQQQTAAAASAPATPPPAATAPEPKTKMPSQSEIFGGGRQPGEDG